MIKRVITITLIICMIFSVKSMATSNDNNVDSFNINVSKQNTMSDRTNSRNFIRDNSNNIEEVNNLTTNTNNNQNNNLLQEQIPNVKENTPVKENGDLSDKENITKNMPSNRISQFGNNFQNNMQTSEVKEEGVIGFIKTYSTPITSVILLILAYFFVIFYKRKQY